MILIIKHNAKKDNYLKDNINFEELKNAFLNMNIRILNY